VHFMRSAFLPAKINRDDREGSFGSDNSDVFDRSRTFGCRCEQTIAFPADQSFAENVAQ
jgi:hypothetical protein